MSEADVVKDIEVVLAKVRQGREMIVEQGNNPVAIIKPTQITGRMVSEIIADLEMRGSNAVMDDTFAQDIEEGLRAQRQPWTPPSSE